MAKYLKGADLQAETDEQLQNLRLGLSDMLEMPASELRVQKYANYQGEPNQWLILKLLNAHFVSVPPQTGLYSEDPEDVNCFFEDVSKPEARVVISKWLKEIDEMLKPKDKK